jgi:5-methyltetrahydropteroyltriglutamate--homocysteine methyltransferase
MSEENAVVRTQTHDSEARRWPPRAEHVGSLLRPKRLLERMGDFNGSDANVAMAESQGVPDELRALEDELIRDAVARQIDAGLDVVTDGEFRRAFFTGGVDVALRGFQPNQRTIVFENAAGETMEATGRPTVASRLEKVDNPLVREAEFLKGITDHPFKITMPAASMYQWYGVWTPGITDKAYRDPDELADHFVTLLREFIDEAVSAGCRYVQFDFPFYPLYVNERHRANWRAMGFDDDAYLERILRVDRQVVAGLPSDVHTSLHLCRGNAGAWWLTSGSIEPVAEQVFSLPYDSFLVEWDDKERDGDYSALRHVPKGPVVAVGIVSTKRAVVESADEVMQEIDTASTYLDVDQLALTAQCGFGTVAGMESVDEDTQWRKLALIGDVADRVWPRSNAKEEER